MYEFMKNKLALNCNTNLLISRHLALITHDATMSVNSSYWRLGVMMVVSLHNETDLLYSFQVVSPHHEVGLLHNIT